MTRKRIELVEKRERGQDSVKDQKNDGGGDVEGNVWGGGGGGASREFQGTGKGIGKRKDVKADVDEAPECGGMCFNGAREIQFVYCQQHANRPGPDIYREGRVSCCNTSGID